ncbi:hypothetical protein RISK_002631 [Rhodopirellula islandica]|uniref:Uncharacterized protein n=1 Tax=Rhodopirellula islandica TaxID=595434 RepID=A0A0J1EIV4_RHOIS|nr:hypothetical protein RISK_002631 [Rhodopirellula islandica]
MVGLSIFVPIERKRLKLRCPTWSESGEASCETQRMKGSSHGHRDSEANRNIK